MGTGGYRGYYYVTGISIFRFSLVFQARSHTVKINLLLKNSCHLLHMVSEVDRCVSFCAIDSLTPLLSGSFERNAAAHETGRSISLPPHPTS